MGNSKRNQKKVSLAEYAAKHNTQLNRRKLPMSESYLYRLIRQTEEGTATRDLWFNYVMEGEKKHIFILLD